MKSINKFYSTTYNILTPYFKNKESINLLIVSDIHYQVDVDNEIFKNIVCYAQKTKPNFIIMPGDVIELIDFTEIHEYKTFFEGIFNDLSKLCPVIIVPGNHEIRESRANNFKDRLKIIDNEPEYKAINYFQELEQKENIYFLNNKQITINGISFIGFNPKYNSYSKIKDKKIQKEFVKDYLSCNFNLTENDYNILITHSSLQIFNNSFFNCLSDLKKIDLVITGHLHDGYLPKFLDKVFNNTNVGIFITPLLLPFPGIKCRGIHNFGRGFLFISQGYRKFTGPPFTSILEKITANDVENIIISHDKFKNFTTKENRPLKK